MSNTNYCSSSSSSRLITSETSTAIWRIT